MRFWGSRLPLFVLLAVVIIAVGCGANAKVSGSALSGSPSGPPAPQFSNIVLVIEENHSYSQVIGNSAMPFLNQLASHHALATQYFADAHPSLPNYFMMTTGQPITFNDNFSGIVADDNIARELINTGKSWKVYAESLPSAGYTGTDVFPYVKHHNPFAYFSDVVGTSQASNMVPFSQFSGDMSSGQLPTFSFIVPNIVHDAHSCPDGTMTCADNLKLSTADTWLQQNIGPLLNDSNFQKSGLLLVVFDEGELSDIAGIGGHVALVLAGTGVKGGFQSTTHYDHAALLRMILEAAGGGGFPGASAIAPEMGEFF